MKTEKQAPQTTGENGVRSARFDPNPMVRIQSFRSHGQAIHKRAIMIFRGPFPTHHPAQAKAGLDCPGDD